MAKMQQLKDDFLKEHTVEDMVYENGSALGMIFREITKIKQELGQIKNILNGNEN